MSRITIPCCLMALVGLLVLFSCAGDPDQIERDLDYYVSAPPGMTDSPPRLGRSYTVIHTERFDTESRVAATGFVLQRAGRFGIDDGTAWIIGESDGNKRYAPYYSSDPDLMPIQSLTDYELSYDYLILEEPDEGFETIFYSPEGGNNDEWLPGLLIEGRAGTEGRAVLRNTTGNYDDYRLVFNVVQTGSVAIRNIRLVETESGRLVGEDTGAATRPWFSPGITLTGSGTISEGPDGTSVLTVAGPAEVTVDESVFLREPGSVVLMEFDYRVVSRPESSVRLGQVRLIPANESFEPVVGLSLDPLCPDSGRFVGGFTLPSVDVQSHLVFQVESGVILEIFSIEIVLQEPTPADPSRDIAAILASASYPRLGNYQLGMPEWTALNGNGAHSTGTTPEEPWISVSELERRWALNDIVAGLAPRTQDLDAGFRRRLDALNPDLVILPYTISQEQFTYSFGDLTFPLDVPPYGTTVEIRILSEFDDRWWLRYSNGEIMDDDFWAGIRKMNSSTYCPPDALGRDFIDYYVETTRDLILDTGFWDGVFMDNLFARTNPHISGAWDPAGIDADYNRNGRADETLPWIHETTAAASARQLRQLRDTIGDDGLVLGNAWAIPERALAPLINGYVFEGFNAPWYQDHNVGTFQEIHWSKSLATYRYMEENCLSPSVQIIQAGGLNSVEAEPQNKPRHPDNRDIRVQRIALGSALLGDGFYEYDVYDNRSAPVFFDEWLVDENGKSNIDSSGKGWLGRPESAAEEIRSGTTSLGVQTSSVTLTPESGSFEIVLDNRQFSTSRVYVLEYRWSVEETLALPFSMEVRIGDERQHAAFNDMVAGLSFDERLHVTVPAEEEATMVFIEPIEGRVTLQDIRLSVADGLLFVRSFDHGLVVVNPTNKAWDVDLDEIGEDRAYARITGTLDPQRNNGRSLSGRVTVPAADALILRATE